MTYDHCSVDEGTTDMMKPVALLSMALFLSLSCERQPPSASPSKEQIHIGFDLSSYRKLARQADGIVVGKVKGTKAFEKWASAKTVREIEVTVPSSNGPVTTTCLRPTPHQFDELLKHIGETFLFFWTTTAPGMDDRAHQIIGYFPLDEKHQQVLKWLDGESDEFTLFDPKSSSLLPDNFTATWSLKYGSVLVVRLANRGSSAVVIERPPHPEFPPDVSIWITSLTGRVVWHGHRSIVTNYAVEQPRQLVELKPGDSMELPVRCLGEGQNVLGRGEYIFEFRYDSRGCTGEDSQNALRTEIVVYGKFAVE